MPAVKFPRLRKPGYLIKKQDNHGRSQGTLIQAGWLSGGPRLGLVDHQSIRAELCNVLTSPN